MICSGFLDWALVMHVLVVFDIENNKFDHGQVGDVFTARTRNGELSSFKTNKRCLLRPRKNALSR